MKNAIRLFGALLLLAPGAALAANPPVEPSPGPPSPAEPSDENGSNLVLNGDFENTTYASCAFNLSNADFTAGMANATGYGSSEQIDVMYDPTGCGYGLPPQSGNVKIGIACEGAATPVDAFTLDLSSTTVVGQAYDISFWGSAYISDFSPETGAVRIGLSNDPASFGVEVFSATPTQLAWTQFSTTFVATVSAAYLSVEQASTGDIWNHIDNFSLQLSDSTPTNESTWGQIKNKYR